MQDDLFAPAAESVREPVDARNLSARLAELRAAGIRVEWMAWDRPKGNGCWVLSYLKRSSAQPTPDSNNHTIRTMPDRAGNQEQPVAHTTQTE
jgi:hypothetical protein